MIDNKLEIFRITIQIIQTHNQNQLTSKSNTTKKEKAYSKRSSP
jgi:hypothetical protein